MLYQKKLFIITLIKSIFLFLPFLSFADAKENMTLTSHQILKEFPISKISKKRSKSGLRTILANDFNNDGFREFIGMSFSEDYMNYVWKNNIRTIKKNDKSYWKKGAQLSKNISWSANLEFQVLNNTGLIVNKWKPNIDGNQNCVHPSQIIPSHLNTDGFLDFVFVCHGYDAHPYPGEHSYVMLSLGANSYKINQLTDKIGFYHDGATADFNNDSFLDILLVDSISKKLRVWINDGNGNFTLKTNYFSQFDTWRAFTTEILDINDDGYFDIFLAGHEDENHGAFPTIILLGNKNNKFSKNNKITIPKVKGYGVVLDVIRHKNFLFVVRTGSKENFYKGSLIQQIDINNLSEFKVIENKNMRWLDRIFLIKNFGEFPKFGSLTEINDDLDFTFDGLNMKLIK